MRLQRDRRGVTVLFGDPQPLPDAVGAVVGDSEVANLARDDQCIEGFERFFERSLRVVEMRVVEIDAVRLQAPQRRLSCRRDVVGLQALEIGMATHLGGDDDVVLQSPIGDPFPDDRFGFPTGIAGSDAVYESEVSMKFAPASANESRISKDVFSSAVHPKGLPPKLSRKMSRSEFPMIATVWNSRR